MLCSGIVSRDFLHSKMADDGEAAAFPEDQPQSKPESEEQTSPIFGETTEITLDGDDMKKDETEAVTEELKTEQKYEGIASAAESEVGGKPEASSRAKLEVCILCFILPRAIIISR